MLVEFFATLILAIVMHVVIALALNNADNYATAINTFFDKENRLKSISNTASVEYAQAYN